MARTCNASRSTGAAPSPRRQNPSRISKSRITQLADPATSSELSEDEIVVDTRNNYSDSESDGLDFVIDADKTSKALGIPAQRKPAMSKPASERRNTRQSSKQEASLRNKRGTKKTTKRKRRDPGSALPRPSKRSRQSPQRDAEATLNSGIIPDWTDPRIDFGCWVDIFYYAAYDATMDSVATNWLLQAATSCKHFAEPAMDTLYHSPAIRHQAKAKKLANLLEQPVSETTFNYRSKIEILHLDIHVVPRAIMYQLIHPLPRLRELIICTPFDQPPYRELNRSIRWHYPADIFQALLPGTDGASEASLKPYHATLKSWEWSGRLIGGYVDGLKDISRVHGLPSFNGLTRVSFTNFQTPSLHKRSPKNDEEALQFLNNDNADIEAIAASLTKLPSLSHLVFESSTVLNDHMLSLLPRGLLHLELINCWDVRSDDLAAFLRDKGGEMRILTLHHNLSLDLAFLTDLAETCPKLRELNMNLSYYKLNEAATDLDPMYDEALLPNQVPRWPSSIRVINIEHIRNWSVEAAVMFLQTLIDNAPNLPNLRHLSVKTMLDIPWQSRAVMRTAWRDKMEKIFLRPCPGLPREFRTLHPSTLEQETNQTTPPRRESSKNRGSLPPTPPSRRSTRIAEHDIASQANRKSYRDPDTDEDELSEAESSASEDADNASTASDDTSSTDSHLPVHGLCKTVDIVFDNQKVRELQYGMEDFQEDNNQSDDDEWNGDYESDDPVLQF